MTTFPFLLSNIETMLCLALSSAPIAEKKQDFDKIRVHLSNPGWLNALCQLAYTDEVAPHLAELFTQMGSEVPPLLEKEHARIEAWIGALLSELDHIAFALSQKNIPIIALKNAGIAKGIFKNKALSPMGDLDLLVQPEQFKEAHQAILELGYTFKFRSTLETEDLAKALAEGSTEYYKETEAGKIWVELQWRPIAGRWIQPENEPKAADLFARSVVIPGSEVRLLSPEDNLIQVGLHTAKHSFVRAPGFRLHSDVDRIVRGTVLDWEVVLKRSKALEVQTALYFSFYFAKNLLKTPIPEEVLKKLAPSLTKKMLMIALLKKAGLFNQTQKKFTKWGYILFVILLYDRVGLLIQAIFPKPSVIKKQYRLHSSWTIPIRYVQRLVGLLVKREGI